MRMIVPPPQPVAVESVEEEVEAGGEGEVEVEGEVEKAGEVVERDVEGDRKRRRLENHSIGCIWMIRPMSRSCSKNQARRGRSARGRADMLWRMEGFAG